MTERKPANTASKSAKAARAPRKRAPAAAPVVKTAGQQLIDELSKPEYPYSLRFLIEQAAHTADYVERLRALHAGDPDAWLKVKIGVKTVEVVVNDPLKEARMQSEQLRRLLVEIHRQIDQLPATPNGNGDPLSRY